MNKDIIAITLAGLLAIAIWPAVLNAQEAAPATGTGRLSERESQLASDLKAFAERAERDNVIDKEEKARLLRFVSDSLPEQVNLRISILEELRDRLDSEYDRMIKESQDAMSEAGIYGRAAIPKILGEPEGYTSDGDARLAREQAAALRVREGTEKYFMGNRPLQMPLMLRYALRLLFGRGTSNSPELWDREVVPVHGGLYDIYLPGGKPSGTDETVFNDTRHFDPSTYKKQAPAMEYDPHPDKHFRR